MNVHFTLHESINSNHNRPTSKGVVSMPHKQSPERQITRKKDKHKKTTVRRSGYLNSIYLGSSQEVYEIQRIATVSGAGTVSSLVRTWNNKAKAQYNDRLTLLEEAIKHQAELGNVEFNGLLAELRCCFDARLSPEFLQLALNSLVRRGVLVIYKRGGKTDQARGATIKCYFPANAQPGSNYSIASPSSNYEGDGE